MDWVSIAKISGVIWSVLILMQLGTITKQFSQREYGWMVSTIFFGSLSMLIYWSVVAPTKVAQESGKELVKKVKKVMR